MTARFQFNIFARTHTHTQIFFYPEPPSLSFFKWWYAYRWCSWM